MLLKHSSNWQLILSFSFSYSFSSSLKLQPLKWQPYQRRHPTPAFYCHFSKLNHFWYTCPSLGIFVFVFAGRICDCLHILLKRVYCWKKKQADFPLKPNERKVSLVKQWRQWASTKYKIATMQVQVLVHVPASCGVQILVCCCTEWGHLGNRITQSGGNPQWKPSSGHPK